MSRARQVFVLAPCALALLGCSAPESESLRFARGPTEVKVTFLGEVSDDDLFGPGSSLLVQVQPADDAGVPRKSVQAARPGWLHFDYEVDGERREVFVAKRPVMNHVSWDDIARAGAALPPPAGGDPAFVVVSSGSGARVRGRDGEDYVVRLPTCGQSTLGDLSEWNLLIGAVHRGDMDFSGNAYGWVEQPYDDEDLKVGFHGSLSWCQDTWQGERVTRGYFFVSRFHAAPSHLRTDRLSWRPVLERVGRPAGASMQPFKDDAGRPVRWSPAGRVGYSGVVSNAELFGPDGRIDDMVKVEGGRRLEAGQPDWLRFLFDGKTLLVAAKPVRLALSWDAIAKAGAALGDGSGVRQGWASHPQNAEVTGLDGKRYRVRLIDCGQSTLDIGSEWNALLGGVHRGDGDFLAYPAGVYGWFSPSFDDQALHIGFEHGSATWCRNTMAIDGEVYGVNRGYLTISRFHATPTGFAGAGFGWRPVLELLH